MKKKQLRLVLDIVLFIALVTLMNSRFIGVLYHEIVGLVAGALTILHIAINLRSLMGFGKKWKTLPTSYRLGFVIDVLLILDLLWLIVSGILISKKILLGISSSDPFFKRYHLFIGMITLLLMGIHVRLHLRKRYPVVLVLVITVLVIVLVVFAWKHTTFFQYLKIPFSSETEHFRAGKGIGKGLHKGSGQGKGEKPMTAVESIWNILYFSALALLPALATHWCLRLSRSKKERNVIRERR